MAKKFVSQPSLGKVMLALFRDMEGVILVYFTPRSPHLASSDFHMFGSMKEALRERRFFIR
jgi:hypothetical protein